MNNPDNSRGSMLLVGVRHGTRTSVIKLQSTDGIKELYAKINAAFLVNSKLRVYMDVKCTLDVESIETPDGINLKSGTMLFLTNSTTGSNPNEPFCEEDCLDEFLDNVNIDDIAPNEPTSLCSHSTRSRCLKCLKRDPFDEEYLSKRDPPIKHLSFHAYLRKLKINSSGKYLAMEEISCKVAKGCSNHLPWPRGICTRCQPSGMMLQRQAFRHVDNVMFENSTIADRFLDFWRKSGTQRLGFMFGSYEYYDNVPLGIRAVVKSIYEPPQIADSESIELLEDKNDELIDSIASGLGLCRIGWIFTDLVALTQRNGITGTVQCVRGDKDLHFLSAQECIMAARLQHKYPNKCRFSKSGFYGSRFVTIVVTGDSKNNIHFEGYQVSNQCTALVKADCLVPTVDDPGFAFLRESSPKQYIPDVSYKFKDDFGNEVTTLARPLPVEYLLIDVPAAFAIEPTHSLRGEESNFPIENRSTVGALQNLASFLEYYNLFNDSMLVDMFGNLHFLLFLANNEWMNLTDADLSTLLLAVKEQNENALIDFRDNNGSWNTLVQLAQLAGDSHHGTWACRMCTFLNTASSDICSMCGGSQDVEMD